MSNSLPSLGDNISDGLCNDKCIDCNSCLEYILIIKIHKYIFKFCDGDINKFTLLWGK